MASSAMESKDEVRYTTFRISILIRDGKVREIPALYPSRISMDILKVEIFLSPKILIVLDFVHQKVGKP